VAERSGDRVPAGSKACRHYPVVGADARKPVRRHSLGERSRPPGVEQGEARPPRTAAGRRPKCDSGAKRISDAATTGSAEPPCALGVGAPPIPISEPGWSRSRSSPRVCRTRLCVRIARARRLRSKHEQAADGGEIDDSKRDQRHPNPGSRSHLEVARAELRPNAAPARPDRQPCSAAPRGRTRLRQAA